MDGWMGNKTHDDERNNQQSADTLLPSLAQDAVAAIEIKMKKMENCKEGHLEFGKTAARLCPEDNTKKSLVLNNEIKVILI